jgi:hypothetical protein
MPSGRAAVWSRRPHFSELSAKFAKIRGSSAKFRSRSRNFAVRRSPVADHYEEGAMENKVGAVIPSEKEIASRVDEMRAVSHGMARYTVELTVEQRKHLPKMRAHGEQMVPLIAQLARDYGLHVPGMDVDQMLADQSLAQRLAAAQAEAAALAQRIDDTVLEAQGECWTAATAFYSVLSSMAARDGELANRLRPVTDFFATGRRKPTAVPAK